MQSEALFEAALGVASPWYVRETEFDGNAKTLTIRVDFRAGNRFAHTAEPGQHPIHDTQVKHYRHLNFFQHECFLEVRVPRVKLSDGAVRLVEPPWASQLSGFTLLFKALVLALCREMPFAAAARPVGESWHRVAAIAGRCSKTAGISAMPAAPSMLCLLI
jgi:transposase